MVWGLEEPEQVEPGQVQMGWAGERKARNVVQTYWAGPMVAVLPIHNVTAAPAPVKELERLLSDSLKKQGVSVLEKKVLADFMKKWRMRYTGGLDEIIASAIKDLTGVESVLVSTLEFFDDGDPPRISLHSRLVSTGVNPEIKWIDSVCLAGDDAPGIMGLSVIDDPQDLMEIAARHLTRSLILHLADDEEGRDHEKPVEGIPPSITFRSQMFGSKKEISTVAVLPFLNLSERPYAWEILPLHLVQRMVGIQGYRILEPGVVRRGLLNSRVMVQGGLSLPHLELALRYTDADLVITGTVMRYIDGKFARTEPEVEFSVQVFDRESKKVVWSSRSVGSGDSGIYFFDVGQRSTACKLASELVQATVTEMTQDTKEESNETITEGMGL